MFEGDVLQHPTIPVVNETNIKKKATMNRAIMARPISRGEENTHNTPLIMVALVYIGTDNWQLEAGWRQQSPPCWLIFFIYPGQEEWQEKINQFLTILVTNLWPERLTNKQKRKLKSPPAEKRRHDEKLDNQLSSSDKWVWKFCPGILFKFIELSSQLARASSSFTIEYGELVDEVELTDSGHVLSREILGDSLLIRNIIIQIVAPGLHRGHVQFNWKKKQILSSKFSNWAWYGRSL